MQARLTRIEQVEQKTGIKRYVEYIKAYDGLSL